MEILYDRQLRTYGLDTLDYINNSSVLIFGSNTNVKYEICKNLLLSGINTLYLSELPKKSIQDFNSSSSILLKNTYNQDQTITILIDYDNDEIQEINNYTRNNNTKLILLFTYGFGGDIFVDAGNEYIIKDVMPNNNSPIIINKIENNGIIKSCLFHNLESNDLITFSNLEGYNLDEFKKEWSITIIDNTSFQLNNFNIKNFKFINGCINIVKQEIIINHSKFINYKKKYNFNFEFDLMPVASILGSLVVSETIKIITHKYTPINQWLNWEEESLKPILNQNYISCKTIYGKLYGPELEEQILTSRWLIVGAGAIGCEHLKNMEYFNNIIITDPDIIEKSNLSRQFLFRDKDIGKLKSKIASEKIKELYPEMNIEYMSLKVGYDNINFKDMNLTGIFTALDNIEGRIFMDQNVSFELSIPLFDSGTEGLKGSIQPVIPFITDTYSDTKDPETDTIPVCTIKSYPNKIEHCVIWAKDKFEELIKNKCFNFDEYFNQDITKLLLEFPINKINDDGSSYWTGGKKMPVPLIFNNLDNNHKEFINLTNKIIESNLTFDKENKICIEWILHASNFRAENYNITKTDYYTCKGIAGKIIPAVCTTTSLVSGLIIIETLKYLMNKNNQFKSYFINLALPLIIYSEPSKSSIMSINDFNFNKWYKLSYIKDTLLSEFKSYYEIMFNIEINVIIFDGNPIYVEDVDESNLNKKISEITDSKIIDAIINSKNILSNNNILPMISIKL